MNKKIVEIIIIILSYLINKNKYEKFKLILLQHKYINDPR